MPETIKLSDDSREICEFDNLPIGKKILFCVASFIALIIVCWVIADIFVEISHNVNRGYYCNYQ